MKILLLEDDPDRVEQFKNRVTELNERNYHTVNFELIHTETAEHCIAEIEKHIDLEFNDRIHLILLDHDLGGQVYVNVDNTNTGSEVARWINKNPEKIKGISVITHTFNPAGAKNIVELIPGCIYIPAIWTKDNFHRIIK